MGSTSLPSESGGHFFRVMFTRHARSDRLRIPTEFMRRCGNTVPNHVFLEVPSGVVWPAELRKSSGAIWLQKGWQEFRDFYNIGFGYLLVFRFDGKSHFHVLIFDRSTLEMEYPFSATHRVQKHFTGESQIKTEDVEVNDSVEIPEEFLTCQTRNASVEILDDYPSCLKKREKSQPQPMPTDKSEIACNHQAFGQSTLGQSIKGTPVKSEVNKYPDHSIQGVGDGPKRCQLSKFPAGRKRLASDVEKLGAFQSAKIFKSKNPFLKVLMRPSYIGGSYLFLKKRFFELYFSTKQEHVTLQVPDGRTWSVKYTFEPGSSVRVSGEWGKFVRDNSLAVGDLCIFELINGVENSLKVAIFRAAEDAVQAKQKDIESDDSVDILEEFPTCYTKEKSPISCSQPCKKTKANPTCEKTNLNCGFRMPKIVEDGRGDFEQMGESQRTKEKSIPPHSSCNIKTRLRRIRKNRNSSDPKSFVQSTGPKAKRVKQVKSEDVQFLYCSMQGAGDEPKRCERSEVSTGWKQLASNPRNAKALDSAKAFKSRYPFFMVVIGPGYVAGPSLYVPGDFAKEYFKQHHKEVTLQVSDGKTWSSTCAILHSSVRINGWATFAGDNSLAVGDVCVFQLINTVKILLKVVIFRAAEQAD